MTRQPSPRHRREAEDFLQDRGMSGTTGAAASPPPMPVPGAGAGGVAGVPARSAFAHRGMDAAPGRPPGPALAAHAEQPGHRHRGAERHSAH